MYAYHVDCRLILQINQAIQVKTGVLTLANFGSTLHDVQVNLHLRQLRCIEFVVDMVPGIRTW